MITNKIKIVGLIFFQAFKLIFEINFLDLMSLLCVLRNSW